MKNLNSLKIRLIDTHIILLGIEEHWIRLSLPWIARDIAELLGQVESKTTSDDPLERLPILKMTLTQLQIRSTQKELKNSSLKSPKEFYTNGHLVTIDKLNEVDKMQDVLVVSKASELMTFENSIKEHQGWISLLIYSDQAVMLSPLFRADEYCLFCYRYLIALPFGLTSQSKKEDEKNFLDVGVVLGKTVKRDTSETLFFDGKKIEVKPFVPFIGCPHCSKDESC